MKKIIVIIALFSLALINTVTGQTVEPLAANRTAAIYENGKQGSFDIQLNDLPAEKAVELFTRYAISARSSTMLNDTLYIKYDNRVYEVWKIDIRAKSSGNAFEKKYFESTRVADVRDWFNDLLLIKKGKLSRL